MSIKEEHENMDLDSMADDLSGIAPPAPSVPVSNISTSATPGWTTHSAQKNRHF